MPPKDETTAPAGPAHSTTHQFAGALVEHVRKTVDDIREFDYASGRSLLMFGVDWVSKDAVLDVAGLRTPVYDLSGKFGFFPSGTGIRGHVVPARAQSYLCMHFKSIAALVDPGLDDRDLGLEPEPVFENDVMATLARALIADLEEPRSYGRLFGDTLLTAVAIELARRRLAGQAPPARGGLSRRQTALAVDFLESHIAEDVALPELAGVVGLSPWHFNRAFKRTVGLPPYRWLAARRVERAKTLLANPTLTIHEIAVSCGFGGAIQFARAFKRATGASPRTFRHQSL